MRGANYCIDRIYVGGEALCIQNPATGRERTMPQVIARIEAARAEGIDVAANVYPYAASSTGLSTLAPNWALEGGYDDFQQRLKKSGYRAQTGAENIGAGYHTLAEAFSGWRDSPGHKANMLLKGATQMGIAAVYVPNTKYKVFWALVIAAPDNPRTAQAQ